MTDKQRGALEAMNAAREQGRSLTQYAQAHGLVVRELYNVLAALRRKDVLAKSGRDATSKFVSVQVTPAAAARMTPSGQPEVVGRLDGYDVWRMKPHEALHVSVFS